jgi:hypothetical protein
MPGIPSADREDDVEAKVGVTTAPSDRSCERLLTANPMSAFGGL